MMMPGMLLAAFIIARLTAEVELLPEAIEYRSIFGIKRFAFADITSIKWGAGRGQRWLIIRAGKPSMMIGNLPFSDSDLHTIEDAVRAMSGRLES